MIHPNQNPSPFFQAAATRFVVPKPGLRFAGETPPEPPKGLDQTPPPPPQNDGDQGDKLEINQGQDAAPANRNDAQNGSKGPEAPEATDAVEGTERPEAKIGAEEKADTAQQQPQSNFTLRMKEAKGLFFWKVVPLMFSFSFFGGPLGFAVGLAGIPISYFSGKYGRKVLKDINPDQLSNMSKFAQMLEHPENLKDGQIVEQLNLVAKDMLNGIPILRHLPNVITTLATLPSKAPWLFGLFPGISGKLKSLTGMSWKFSKDKGLGKLLNTRIMLRANVLTRVANADSVGEAAINGTKGALNYFFWMKMVAPVGKWVTRLADAVPGFMKWPIKAAGVAIENAALIKMGIDIAQAGNTSAPAAKGPEAPKTPPASDAPNAPNPS